MFLGFLIAALISGFIFYLNYRFGVKQRDYGNGLLKISDREYKEVVSDLEKQLLISNQYYRMNAIALFITLKRKYPLEVAAKSLIILPLCEIAVLRELNYQLYQSILGDGTVYEQLLTPVLRDAINTEAITVVRKITGKEDRSFYNINKDAWEITLYHLQNAFSIEQTDLFYRKVCELGCANSGRITVERKIYFASYQFLVVKDRKYALKLYLHYLSVRTAKATFKHRKIPARDRKILFKKKEEQEYFDKICAGLLEHKDLQRAIDEFAHPKISRRKKISLDRRAIKTVAEKQSKVAGILSEWLNDEDEDKLPPVKQQAIEKEEEISITEQETDHKKELFRLFITHSFKVNKEEVNIFAHPRRIFISQFIERINEEYYEELDDVLIEEDNDYYIINEPYFQQIIQNGF